jgi:peptide/nickel transport system substrate-binding protein
VTQGPARPRAARIRTRAVAVATCALLFVAGCGASAATTTSTTVTGGKSSALVAISGGKVTVAVPAVATSLNPHTVAGDSTATRMVTALTDPQVFQVAPGLAPVLDTDFVVSAEVVSVNPQTVVYDLNPNATWSDNVPIGVQDFIFNWQQQAGPPASSGANTPPGTTSTLGYRDIETITGPSTGHTVRVVFKRNFADWADLFDDLMPAHLATEVGWSTGYQHPGRDAFVSGGPYEISSWIPGSRITLRRNPEWWGTPGKVATITLVAESGTENLTKMLGDHSVEAAYATTFDATLLQMVSSSATTHSQEDLGTTMLQLVFDMRRPADQSAATRQGVALELDRRSIVHELVGPLDPGVEVDDDFLATNAQRSYTRDGTQFDSVDAAEATGLLESAGLRKDSKGSWESGGAPVALDLRWATGDPWSDLVAPAIEAELLEAGFEVHAQPLAKTELDASDLHDTDWDLALLPTQASAYPGQMARYYSTSSGVTGQGESLDTSGFDAPDVDALFDDAALELDPARAALLYQQIDLLLWQAMPALPLFAEPTLLVNDADLSGLQADAGGAGPLWGAASWAILGPASSAPKH